MPQENEVAFSCPLWSVADLIIDDQIGKYGVVLPVLLCPFRARADHLSDYVKSPISAKCNLCMWAIRSNSEFISQFVPLACVNIHKGVARKSRNIHSYSSSPEPSVLVTHPLGLLS